MATFSHKGRRKRVRCPTGKSPKSCPALCQKIFHFACRANHLYKLAPSRLISEGRFAIVTDVERGMRWTRAAPLTNGADADGEVVWS
jgi:hypothetical protein